jgi:hypothetical protein
MIPWLTLLVFLSTGNDYIFDNRKWTSNVWRHQKKLCDSILAKIIQSMQFTCSNRTSAVSKYIYNVYTTETVVWLVREHKRFINFSYKFCFSKFCFWEALIIYLNLRIFGLSRKFVIMNLFLKFEKSTDGKHF